VKGVKCAQQTTWFRASSGPRRRILDPDNPYRYLTIRGRVVKITEEGAVEHINGLAKKYRGLETYRSRSPREVRVMYVIEPRRVAGQG